MRVKVMDVWFDSDAMPFAQDHYQVGVKNRLSCGFYLRRIDQTRGWFTRTLSGFDGARKAYKM